jgi:hypothetical protein
VDAELAAEAVLADIARSRRQLRQPDTALRSAVAALALRSTIHLVEMEAIRHSTQPPPRAEAVAARADPHLTDALADQAAAEDPLVVELVLAALVL